MNHIVHTLTQNMQRSICYSKAYEILIFITINIQIVDIHIFIFYVAHIFNISEKNFAKSFFLLMMIQIYLHISSTKFSFFFFPSTWIFSYILLFKYPLVRYMHKTIMSRRTDEGSCCSHIILFIQSDMNFLINVNWNASCILEFLFHFMSEWKWI